MNINMHFRADIHSFRDLPGEQPFETTVLFNAMHDASVTITASGSYVYPEAPCLNTFTFSAAINLPSPYETSQEGGWTYFGSVNSQSHELQLDLHILTFVTKVGTWVRSGPTDCGLATIPLYGGLKVEDCVFDDVTAVTGFRMPMGPDYDVTADSRGPCTVEPLVTYLSGVGLQAQASIHWDDMATFFPPDPEAAR